MTTEPGFLSLTERYSHHSTSARPKTKKCIPLITLFGFSGILLVGACICVRLLPTCLLNVRRFKL